MGVLKKLPLKDEDIMNLTPTTKVDPYKLLTKLRETQNDSTCKISPARQTLNADPEQAANPSQRRYSMEDLGDHKTMILPNIKARLSSNETVPYSEFIIGARSSVK
uniref:Uncharacterized protein n=1 Tax=Euplotes harpa TaxID=151035 RepID=A0A7S3NFM6_9SPIT|mmetsp:Transcript_6100/g.7068  ORF Transcript_6100/g.7068 Transcript_6100/m.7068 type:complete len:106 (+) Transcript_6100:110-427(+)